jgi:hypothetical protein
MSGRNLNRRHDLRRGLAGLLALVGERVEVHVMAAGETPHLVATFGGGLQAGCSMTGGELQLGGVDS